MTRPLRIVSWNIARRTEPWYELLDMGADIALLQEAAEPPANVMEQIAVGSEPWTTAGDDSARTRKWRTAVVALTDRVEVEWLRSGRVGEERPKGLAVSRRGTLAVATVNAPGYEAFFIASMYARLGKLTRADSGGLDLFGRVSSPAHLRLVCVHRHGASTPHSHRRRSQHPPRSRRAWKRYWAGRYESMSARMEALDLPFIGPQSPNGRQADPWPDELPRG